MKIRKNYLPAVFVLWLVLLLLPGCSADTSGDADTSSKPATSAAEVVIANPPTVEVMPAVTQAPSGFVPGDALPTVPPAATPTASAGDLADNSLYREVTWEELIPPGFRSEDIMAKYQEELAAFEDGDPAAYELYQQMQQEFNNAPINSSLDQVAIKLPGFIAPLEFENEVITEFLLVPYFGACIHVPPPPVNQTVYVALAEGQGIAFEDSYYPFWVEGYMSTAGLSTDIGEAGYRIRDAVLTPYEYPTG